MHCILAIPMTVVPFDLYVMSNLFTPTNVSWKWSQVFVSGILYYRSVDKLFVCTILSPSGNEKLYVPSFHVGLCNEAPTVDRVPPDISSLGLTGA